MRTGAVTFFIASAGSADIAVLRKALESSPSIAQGIVIQVKVNLGDGTSDAPVVEPKL